MLIKGQSFGNRTQLSRIPSSQPRIEKPERGIVRRLLSHYRSCSYGFVSKYTSIVFVERRQHRHRRVEGKTKGREGAAEGKIGHKQKELQTSGRINGTENIPSSEQEPSSLGRQVNVYRLLSNRSEAGSRSSSRAGSRIGALDESTIDSQLGS